MAGTASAIWLPLAPFPLPPPLPPLRAGTDSGTEAKGISSRLLDGAEAAATEAAVEEAPPEEEDVEALLPLPGPCR